MKLATKLLTVFLFAVALMTGVSTYLTVLRARSQFEQRQREYVVQLGRAWESEILVAFERDGEAGLRRAIQNRAPDVEQLGLKWVWFDPRASAAYRPSTSQDVWGPAQNNRIVSAIVRDGQGVPRIYSYYPLDLAASQRGALEITGSLEPLQRQTRDMIMTAVISLAAIALAGAAIVIVVGVRWVAEPLDRLLAKTRRIGEGDFGEPLRVRSHDELGELGQALNEMCVQLSDQQERIRSEAAGRIVALEQLRHADRLKTVGRLAAGIAHELGTPLNVVSGRAALIASDSLSAEDVRQSAVTIKQEADRIADIIRQLLDFARQRSPRRSKVLLADLAASTLSFLQPLADKRNVEFQLTPCEEPAEAWLDGSQIQQVLTNLVVNAVQAMPEGGVVSIILGSMTASSPDHTPSSSKPYWTIVVEDQGHGIAQDDLKQIFEPFYTTKDVGEGTGLGLSIAFGIVKEHRGWIDVVSTPGKGSRFTVFLPQEEIASCVEESWS